MLKKIVLLVVMLLSLSAVTEAAKIDAYREILLSQNYTISYDNLTPIPRITNRDKINLYGKSGLSINVNDLFVNKPVSGIITSDGNNRYEEIGYNDFYQCRLVKNEETFIFTKYKDKKSGKIEYYGKKKGKVEANSRNYLAELIDGESFGDVNFTRLLNALLSNDDKSSEMVKYNFVNSGKLSNGLTYEDFSANDNGELSAIRYYFEGDKLVKIAFAAYGIDKYGKPQGAKCIIKIREFTSTPNRNMLNLPAGLTDVTKR